MVRVPHVYILTVGHIIQALNSRKFRDAKAYELFITDIKAQKIDVVMPLYGEKHRTIGIIESLSGESFLEESSTADKGQLVSNLRFPSKNIECEVCSSFTPAIECANIKRLIF